MDPELKTKLLSNIFLTTQSEPLSIKFTDRPTLSVGGIISALAIVAAGLGLLMLMFSKVKQLF